MVSYATDERTAAPETCRENPCLPSKNRVWNFLTTPETPTGFSESQPVEPHWENQPTPTNTVSDVHYYGYRFYCPETGRWASRDPSGYIGGRNLYAYLRNSVGNKCDVLGMYDISGPYRQLETHMTPGEWGSTEADYAYKLKTKGQPLITTEKDTSCKDCLRRKAVWAGTVTYSIENLKIELPNWTDYSSASKDEKAAWDSMIKALTAHENHHKQIWESFAGSEDIIGAGNDCAEETAVDNAFKDLERKAIDAFEKRSKVNQETNDKYDKDTDHGVKDGVVLPQI